MATYIDLHQHCLLSASRRSLQKRGLYLPESTINNLQDITNYAKKIINPLLRSEGAIQNFFHANFETAVRSNVILIATSIDYTLLKHFQSDTLFVEFLKRVRDFYSNTLIVEYDIGISRDNFQPSDEDAIADLIESGVFCGIDLYGSEVLGREEIYKDIYRHAGKAGLLRKAHIGEFRSAREIVSVTNLLELDEIQHGINLIEDAGCMRAMAESSIVFNICPTSNHVIRGIRYEDHPARAMVENGLAITIGTDDRLLFGANVQDEYRTLHDRGTLSTEQLHEINQFTHSYKRLDPSIHGHKT